MRFTKTIELKSPASKGFVVVEAAHVKPKGTLVEARINGKSLGGLNRFADRDDGRVHSYRLPIDGSPIRKIEIEVRVRPAKNSGKTKGIDLRALRLELPEPRQ